MKNIKKAETFCPIFTGFYNSIFDESDSWTEREFDNETDFKEMYPELAEIPFDYITENAHWHLDYRPAYLASAQAILDAIPSLYNDHLYPKILIHSVKFQALRSPKEYNFANDAIDCVIEYDEDVLIDYLKVNRSAFEKYLTRKYTSRDGFMSSHSADFEDWEEETEGFTELGGHYLGSILQFIAENEMSEPEMALYYETDYHLSEDFSNAMVFDTGRLKAAWIVTA